MGIGDYPPDEIPDLVQKAKQCVCAQDGSAERCPVHTQADYEAAGQAGTIPSIRETIRASVGSESVEGLKLALRDAHDALEALGRERNTWARQIADLRDEKDTEIERLEKALSSALEGERDAESRLVRIERVYEQYFDTDAKPGDGNPEPEDVWRFDRDMRKVLYGEDDQ